jgi:dephospho-CoA kinase
VEQLLKKLPVGIGRVPFPKYTVRNRRPVDPAVVDASRETRLARAKHRGWTEAEFDQREAAQLRVDIKRLAADAIISNDGTEQELREAVADFWRQHVAEE